MIERCSSVLEQGSIVLKKRKSNLFAMPFVMFTQKACTNINLIYIMDAGTLKLLFFVLWHAGTIL